ncbi:MAG TPA: hypothetical protein VGL52_05825, partial [Casimicrobiaceae bacterium]
VVENLPQDTDFPGFIVPSALPAGVRSAPFDFNQALDVVIPNAETAGVDPPPPAIVLSIPAYDARAYPEAGAPMPISGYNGGNYYDAAHVGEGIIVEIGNRPAGSGEPSRYVSLAWFTYDTEHRPFWLFGVAPFVPGVRAVALSMAAYHDGGFAGDFGASSTPTPWGTVSLSFPDCESMHFEYAARAGLQPPLPAGAGERNWTRVTQANGLACR